MHPLRIPKPVRPPNPRLQRTRAALLLKSVLGERSSFGGDRRAPLSRQPLGASLGES
jgi:hypothetical protein